MILPAALDSLGVDGRRGCKPAGDACGADRLELHALPGSGQWWRVGGRTQGDPLHQRHIYWLNGHSPAGLPRGGSILYLNTLLQFSKTKLAINYVSPHVFSFVVCLSISCFLSRFCVHSISFEPLEGFTNILEQLSSIMIWCAVHMFDQGQFKVKVIVQG